MEDLYRRLRRYGQSGAYPFHMPGHKRNPESGPLGECCGIDITEIDGFDNLHHAEGILRDAQERAARLYGADQSYFLVNGSTGGILSAAAAAVPEKSHVLMARNCHRSAYHAAYLNRWELSFIYPEMCGPCGIAGDIEPMEVERQLDRHPETAAVMITSPTYEGVVSDIRGIAGVVHRRGLPLIVDEAHGAHFGFHPGFPESAVVLGADLVIQSVHKTLPSLTQTALLHAVGGRVDRERLERYLSIYQTSSPSYVLMSSIDSCLSLMERRGEELCGRLLSLRERLLTGIGGCKFVEAAVLYGSDGGRKRQDPGKLVLSAWRAGMSGRRLYDVLREEFGLQLEMAAGRYALAILSVMDTEEGVDRLAEALAAIDSAQAGEGEERPEELCPTVPRPERRMSISQAWDAPGSPVPLEEAAGKISAGFLELYPPGIPIVAPGEKIGEEIVDLLLKYDKMGLPVQGIIAGKCVNVIG